MPLSGTWLQLVNDCSKLLDFVSALPRVVLGDGDGRTGPIQELHTFIGDSAAQLLELTVAAALHELQVPLKSRSLALVRALRLTLDGGPDSTRLARVL